VPHDGSVSSSITDLAARRSPIALNPGELIDIVRRVGDEVRRGLYPQIRFDSETRWHERLHRDVFLDIWLITWMPTQGTLLHDHGNSNGAFAVVSGELSEAVYAPRGRAGEKIVELGRGTGESVGFGSHYIHDVRNLSGAPAVSVHAYSAPLDLMNYYEVQDDTLVSIGSLRTEDPEAEFVHPAAS
jgi:hypothetical protein